MKHVVRFAVGLAVVLSILLFNAYLDALDKAPLPTEVMK